MPARIGNPKRRRRHFIREWRIFRGLTQQTLADALGAGASKTSVSRIEATKTAYTQDFLEACADALGTHPGILLMRAPIAADGVVVELTAETKAKRPSHGRRQVVAVKRTRN
jgi:transcriptional regulator with XRE-family HTH domain